MRKNHFGASLLAFGLLATGCASTPEVTEPTPQIEKGRIEGVVRDVSAKEKELRVRALYLDASERFFKGDIDGCLLGLEKVLILDPTYAPAHFRKSTCFFRKERYVEEITSLEQCTRCEPRFLEGWLNLGHAYLAQERLNDALTAYTHVVELDRYHPIAHYNSGLLQFEFGEYRRAHDHFKTALDSNKLKPDLREKAEHYQRRCEERLK